MRRLRKVKPCVLPRAEQALRLNGTRIANVSVQAFNHCSNLSLGATAEVAERRLWQLEERRLAVELAKRVKHTEQLTLRDFEIGRWRCTHVTCRTPNV